MFTCQIQKQNKMKNLVEKIVERRIIFQIMMLSAVVLIAASCEKEDPVIMDNPEISDPSMMEVLKGAPVRGGESIAEIAINANFDELVSALIYVDEELNAGLVDLFLNGTDQYTVFAPTNEAFEALYETFGVDMISKLPAQTVYNVLLYHVTEGRRASNSVVPPVRPRTIETLLGESFSVDKTGMITAIGNTANITAADISASNGIIHVIDNVILPIVVPSSAEKFAMDARKGAPAPGDQSIAAIAIEAGFSELVAALSYVDGELNAGLVELFLNGTDQYTVFAPTNEAFEALYETFGVDMISKLPAQTVYNVLLYHVTEGRRASNSVVPPVRPRTIETLLGESFSVDKNGMITAIGNTASIVAADISASNGIIHVIDTVILPIN